MEAVVFELAWWQQLLLAVVFVTDLAVFLNLARSEVNDWRLAHRRHAPPPRGGHPAR
jgi:hypothetical protein